MSAAFSHRVQTRWRDFDGLGHVNYAVAFSYLEEGRDGFLGAHGIPRNEYVVGRCNATFRREIDPGLAAVSVEAELREMRRSGMTIAQRIVDSAGEVMVEAEFGIVLWDPAEHGSRPISKQERASLETALKGEPQ